VAPEGTYKPLVGTNPFCVGVPSSKTPVIYDIGTSKIIHAQVMLARRLGEELPPDTAFNADGEMTTNPHEALSGALAVWGGNKGSGLALAVQLLGIVAGAPALPPNLENFGFLIMVINPAMFTEMSEFKQEVDKMIDAWHAAPSLTGSPMRVPFERSNKIREDNRKGGHIEVEAGVIERLKTLISA
jgi:delta1-piperideine-2-carboxylate reductase